MASPSQEQQLHFLLFPLMAQGHMIPLVDIGRLLARRGFIISIVTTPQNALRFETTLARDRESGLQIRLFQLEFPWEQAGLPQGCESLDMLPSRDLVWDFIAAADSLQEPAEELYQKLNPRPSCILSDTSLPYTMGIARKFHVPRISFLGVNCFFYLIIQNLQLFKPHENTTFEEEYFSVPGLPDQIMLSKAQMPKPLPLKLEEFGSKLREAEMSSYGVVFNTFEELEGEYVKELRKARRVWCVGPVSALYHNSRLEQAERGVKASAHDHQYCLDWLDSLEPRSVVYVSFGSLCSPSSSQLVELALGLESSNRPFIWVVRRGSERSEKLEKWMAEDGFGERTKGRGLLIWGWAPQAVILSHPAIGGFLTHCGANSIMEAIWSGLPMATWPIAGDQFINEIFVVEKLKMGVKVGGKREDVKEAIDRLVNGQEEGEERRERAKMLAEMAKRAVGEGGSSQLYVDKLVKDIKEMIAEPSEELE